MSFSGSFSRRRCNDDCIKRIAAHLCRLQNCDRYDTNNLESYNDHDAGSSQDVSAHGETAVAAISSSCCMPESRAVDSCSKQADRESEQVKVKCSGQTIKTEAINKSQARKECCGKNLEIKATAKDTCCNKDVKLADGTKDDCSEKESQKPQENRGGCCGKGVKDRQTEVKCCADKKGQSCHGQNSDASVAFDDDCCSTVEGRSAIAPASILQEQDCDQDSAGCSGERSDKAANDLCVDACCGSDHLEDANTSCSLHLQSAIQRYEYLIRLGRCLCQRVLRDLAFCCCAPNPISDCETHASALPIKPIMTDTFHENCAQPVVEKQSAGEVVEIDVEAAPREHVVVNIVGMTCTGCVKKINSVMKNIQDIDNPVVTFVNETAEFDTTNPAAVIAKIEKETGFKLTRISTEYQHLDISMSESMRDAYSFPTGVIEVEHVKKDHYRLTYDPNMVGARDLIRDGISLAPPAGEPGAAAGQKRFHFMLASFVTSTIFTIPVLVLNWGNTSLTHATKQRVSLPLATLVQLVAIPNFYHGALKSLIYSRVIEMDMLVVISITAAYLYSVVAFGLEEAGVMLEIGPFFETSTLLISLVILGRLITAVARVRAIATISVRSLQSEEATLVSGEKLDARLLQFGDTIKIAPHLRVVTDGSIIAGESAVDESMLTGESIPVMKKAGDKVTAGTVNGSGVLEVRLSRLPGSNSITDIAGAVQDALVSKPNIQDLADKLAGYFVPVVVGIGLIIFLIWIGLTAKTGVSVGLSISYAIAVLAVSCPCALGLAVPMVLVIAGAISARNGVIVRAASAFEQAHRVTDVVFDKTGTLTYADLHVTEQQTFGSLTEEQILRLTKSMVKDNAHPVSAAIDKHLDVATFNLTNAQSIPGCGLEAIWCGSVVRAGNPEWLGIQAQDSTSLCVTVNSELAAIFRLRSVSRPDSAKVVTELQQRGITCHIASGDAAKVVEALAAEVGIEHYRSRQAPAEKQKYVQELQKHGKVVFVGDGTNDAVAVAQADIGVQIGNASDVTDKVADVVLLGSLTGIITILDLSRRSFQLICFNFAWSGLYNLFAILLASGAFVKFRLPPAYAGLGEIVSVMPVILAATSLVFWKAKH